jgi:hypothetical protein
MLGTMIFREIACLAVGALGCLAALSSWVAFAGAMRAGRHYSLLPAASFALCGAAGIFLHPNPAIASFFWVPIVADPTWVLLIAIAVRSVWRKGSASERIASDD